jgi:hypothetical protein
MRCTLLWVVRKFFRPRKLLKIDSNLLRQGGEQLLEKAYSKLKAFLRKIAERTVVGLINALDACADIFKPAECANYSKACGYDTD